MWCILRLADGRLRRVMNWKDVYWCGKTKYFPRGDVKRQEMAWKCKGERIVPRAGIEMGGKEDSYFREKCIGFAATLFNF